MSDLEELARAAGQTPPSLPARFHQDPKVGVTRNDFLIKVLTTVAITAGLGIFAIIAIVIVRQNRPTASTPTAEARKLVNELRAVPMARYFVEKRLKYGPSAKWPNDEQVEQLGQKRFMVRGHVEAANGFGVYRSIPYVADVEDNGNWEWECHSLRLLTGED